MSDKFIVIPELTVEQQKQHLRNMSSRWRKIFLTEKETPLEMKIVDHDTPRII